MANVSKMGFPILRLPILAILEVLSMKNPIEIINFSMSSLKCKKIVRLYFRPGCKYELRSYIMNGTAISIEGTNACWEYEFTSEKNEDNVLKRHESYGTKYETLMKYSTNIIESFFNLLKYIDDLMNFKKMESILFEMGRFPLQNDLIIQEIKNFKKPIKSFELFSEEDAGNVIIDILNHVKGIKSLDLTASFNKDFELTCPPNLSYLYIDDSKWINLRKLLEFNSLEIVLRGPELPDLDVCAFFRSWMSSESHLNLEKFEIDNVKRETFVNVSQNLPHEEFDASIVHKNLDYEQIRKEVEEMREACKDFKDDYNPRFVVILVQRQSRIRIFPERIEGSKRSSKMFRLEPLWIGSAHGYDELVLCCQTPLIGSNDSGWTKNETMNVTNQLAILDL